jgi:hypothetical protein
MMSISNAVYTDFNEFMTKLIDYENIVEKWKLNHPEYSAKVTIFIGKNKFIIQISTCKGEQKK